MGGKCSFRQPFFLSFFLFLQVTMCMAFSCLADFDRELAFVSDKFLVRYDFLHDDFRHWLGIGPIGVLGLPVQLE